MTPRVALLVLVAALAAEPPLPLKVIRVSPTGDADPATIVTVTFDRPVAGSLDRSVDPRTAVTIEPSLPGTLEWRDPVTIRFRPAAPIAPSTTVRVRVGTGFQAMDGSSLAEPYEFSFRVHGPRVLAGLPAGPDQSARFLTPNPRFQLVLSTEADSALLARMVYLEMNRNCPTPGVIALTPGPQLPVADDAPWQFKEAGGWERDRALDPLRRVVSLRPERPLPYGCSGALVAPLFIDRDQPGNLGRWPLETYGAFRFTGAECRGSTFCPTGPFVLRFTNPVKGAEVLRRLTIAPKVDFTIADTADESETWTVNATLTPRTGYLVTLDSSLTDSFGQRLTGYPVMAFGTTGYRPSVSYVQGRTMVERMGRRTLGITYVNVDTLEVLTVPVPDSLEGRFLSRSWYGWGDDWSALADKATRRRIPLGAARDRVSLYGLELPAPDASKPGAPTLFLLRASSPRLRHVDSSARREPIEPNQPIALVQVTDLGVHARIGVEEGVVWVTGASDGRVRRGATVALRDVKGRVLGRAVTDSFGLARFRNLRRPPLPGGTDGEGDWETRNFDGYVDVRLGNDRALVGINQYDPDLSPWRFNVSSAWGDERLPVAAAVFTERGIYRPGDSVFAKAIVRTGMLGALKVPARTDSVKIVFKDRDEGVLRERTVGPSAFGTLQQAVRLPAGAPLGYYQVGVSLKRQGEWKEIAQTRYRVAEYRPPEFLVDVTADTLPKYDGDSLSARVSARYLFGAPMGRARVTWTLRQTALSPWSHRVPNTDGFFIGSQGWWWDEYEGGSGGTSVTESHVDTLDTGGELAIRAPLKVVEEGKATQATLEAVVTDVNRQTVYAAASAVVHPAEFYLGARPEGAAYFWRAGTAQTIRVIAVRPDGHRLDGVTVNGTLVRREWHQVRRQQGGYSELVGEWVSDTVGRCRITTTGEGGACTVTPAAAGNYIAEFRARDRRGRQVFTSLFRWATGPGWVPWSDESQFKMDVIPDKTRYDIGDTATVLFASPFTNAEAWITVEREGLIEQRRIRITDGATTLKFPVTEAWAPNAYVSIVVARGRSAAAGPLDDPGRPTIRVGYAALRVTPERKRLAVKITADQGEYRPAQRARFSLAVSQADGAGARSEVTLWAVDEGVLALTGYTTPDPLDLIYRSRGLGLRLGSNLVAVAPQVPAGDKGRNPGGGGGEGAADVLRSRFRTTAFFLGSVVTDSLGRGTATVSLPDNLTTFRVMAVAVTAQDRYGSGESPMLVTRPLLARAALPRFVRPGDRFAAGVVVNHRLGGTPTVRVSARADGARLAGAAQRNVTLEAGRGREARFDFTALPGDSATFRFDVGGARDSDAVQVRLPVRPPMRAAASVISGLLRDTASVSFTLPAGLDLSRSMLTLSIGASPVSLLRSYVDYYRAYPYLCSEQVASALTPMLALYRARRLAGAGAGDTLGLRRDILGALEILLRRQRPNGGIGLWSATDWTSPWLTAHAGSVLLDAKEAGFTVRDTVMSGIADYLRASLREEQPVIVVASLWENEIRARLTERLAVAEYLSRAGRRDRALENDLARQSALLSPEGRLTLATILARGRDLAGARRLLEPVWRSVTLEGRTVSVPDSLMGRHYFRSLVRPPALLLEATLAVEQTHPLVAPLFETVISRVRQRERYWWNTQDYAAAVRAVNAWLRHFPPAGTPVIEVRAGNRVLTGGDSIVALNGLVSTRGDSGILALRLSNRAATAPAYFALTVTQVPRDVPTRPDYRGIVVERWYENYATGRPTVDVTEGDLVRVRIRVTATEDRSFVVVDDGLPAGLEAVDLSLITGAGIPGPGAADSAGEEIGRGGRGDDEELRPQWDFGSWDGGWWSPFDHRELRDDRVVYAARALWKGTWTASYVARATTPGVFVRPPVHAEEMYNPAVYGRSDGGVFTVRARAP